MHTLGRIHDSDLVAFSSAPSCLLQRRPCAQTPADCALVTLSRERACSAGQHTTHTCTRISLGVPTSGAPKHSTPRKLACALPFYEDNPDASARPPRLTKRARRPEKEVVSSSHGHSTGDTPSLQTAYPLLPAPARAHTFDSCRIDEFERGITDDAISNGTTTSNTTSHVPTSGAPEHSTHAN